MHFGFDLVPADMNDTGRALLVNAIAYIARFTDDRPIVHTPCVFVQGKRLVDRDYLARRLRQPKPDLSGLPYFFAKADFEKHLKDKSVEDVAAWYRQERDYLHADADGKLTVDADARAFGVPPAGREFLGKASAASPARARRTLGDSWPATRPTVPARRPPPRTGRRGSRRTGSTFSSATPAATAGTSTRWLSAAGFRPATCAALPAPRRRRRKTADTRTKSASLDYRRAIWRVVCPIRGRDLPAGSQARFFDPFFT